MSTLPATARPPDPAWHERRLRRSITSGDGDGCPLCGKPGGEARANSLRRAL
jgi:hypothetical protein